MHLRQRLFASAGLLVVLLTAWGRPTDAGMLGSPVPRQRPWQVRLELAGDSFREELEEDEDAEEASSGRALVTAALGLTSWSEVYGRIGLAEFNYAPEFFRGDFGFAYGGGIRLRLLPLPFGTLGAIGQYLRFTSTDNNSIGVEVEGEWEEFDAALGIATRRFGGFEFYGGGAYHHSEVTLKTASTGTRITLQSAIPFRVFLGAHFYPLFDDPSGKLAIAYEIRFVGEIPQFTLGVQYAF